jgi:membrane protein YqaA with SNARE-associated domain
LILVVAPKAFALLARPAHVAHHTGRASVSFMSLIRHWGGPGLFFLAIFDAFPIPTFGGPDILTAILAARHREPWYYYAAMSTAGAVIGACITFRAARQAGASYMQKWFGEGRVNRLLEQFDRWGTGGLLLSTALPVPFPTCAFFAAAGVVKYPTKRFVAVVSAGRALRYSAIALIASLYGRRFIRVLRHPGQYTGWFVLILVIAAALALVALWLRKQMTARYHDPGISESSRAQEVGGGGGA